MRLASVRTRLLVVVAVAGLLAASLAMVSLRRERALLGEASRNTTLAAAREVAALYSHVLDPCEGMLVALSGLPAVMEGDAVACQEVARRLVAGNPLLANVGAVSAAGDVFCSAVPWTAPLNLADRRYVADAVAHRGLGVGEFQVGRITNRASVNLGYPSYGRTGELAAVVFVAVDIGALGTAASAVDLPPGARLSLLDRTGAVLAGRPQVELGGRLPLLDDHADLLEAPAEGRLHDTPSGIVAVVPLGDPTLAWVVAETPWDAVYAASDTIFWQSAGLSVLFALVGVLAIGWAAERLFVRRIEALSAFAQRLTTGELAARSPLADEPDEIGTLSRALDSMAASLEARTRANQRILDAAGEGILALDPGGRILSTNPAAARILGFTAADLTGRDAHSLLHGDAHPAASCPLRAEPDREQQIDDHFQRSDGQVIPIHGVRSPVREAGRLMGTVLFFADQSARVALEEQLRQAQKMEVVGRLAGGVAHDFNNLLTAILGYGELLRDTMGPSRSPRELDEIIKSGHRAAALTRQLLAFSRQDALHPRVVAPNVVIRNMEKLLRRLLREDTQLEFELASDAPNVFIDPGQLEQVLLNLVVNTRDAGARRVRVVTTRADGGGSGGDLLLRVADDGVGMSDAVKSRIFEPFFTTRSNGTGLGLAIVREAVAEVAGSIAVDSAPGQGTSFSVRIPGTSAMAEPAWESTPQRTAGSETILVVEDDPAVRSFVRRALETEGYLVIEAVDGDDAEACADACHGPIDLVLSDLVLPGRDGRHLADLLRARRPELKSLFMTGYGASGDRAPADVLAKPFGARTLTRRVRRVLDGNLDSPSGIRPRPPELPVG